jgi:hypothetical protein
MERKTLMRLQKISLVAWLLLIPSVALYMEHLESCSGSQPITVAGKCS